MGKDSKISWTDHTFNPWWGCTEASAECVNCYARAWAKRSGFDIWGPTSGRRFFGEGHWVEPKYWNCEARIARTRANVFCGSMCDVFEPREDLRAHRERLFRLIEETESLDWLLLTKHPEYFEEFLPADWLRNPRPNVVGMVTAGVKSSLWRVEKLLATPFAKRGLSAEPLLGPLGLKPYLSGINPYWSGRADDDVQRNYLDWVIPGGESGPRARVCQLENILRIVEDCAQFDIPVFVKQLGARPVVDYYAIGDLREWATSGRYTVWNHGARWNERDGQPTPGASEIEVHLRDRAGADPSEWPEVLRVQQSLRTGFGAQTSLPLV
jgi:protein gp37